MVVLKILPNTDKMYQYQKSKENQAFQELCVLKYTIKIAESIENTGFYRTIAENVMTIAKQS